MTVKLLINLLVASWMIFISLKQHLKRQDMYIYYYFLFLYYRFLRRNRFDYILFVSTARACLYICSTLNCRCLIGPKPNRCENLVIYVTQIDGVKLKHLKQSIEPVHSLSPS